MRIGRTSSLAIAYAKLDESNNGDTVRFKNPSASLSLEMENKEGLDGKTRPEIKKVGDGSIIVTFDKTPNPQNSKDVVCPHFIELKWANGCNFDCAWCYLNGTLRFRPMLKKPYLKSPAKISSHLQAFLAQWQRPSLLNTGELSDSLVFEGNGFSLTNEVIPLFKGQKKHKLLILTKSANIRSLLKSESQDCVITSFSLNSSSVARRWERKAPPPEKRIEAAKKLYNNGYEVRIRIDPMVPIRNWKRGYRELVEMIVTNLTPERITLGSLRGLQATINNCKDTSWVKYLDETSNWGKKVGFDKRLEMYEYIIDILKNHDCKRIALCKETVEMWEKLGMNYTQIKCNCVP